MKSVILTETDPSYCIKDVSINWHGTKMAVCSNNIVDIWTHNSENCWIKEDIGLELDKVKCVQRVSWAHPEFGEVLAVSTLNEITIWEFQSTEAGGQWFNRTTPAISEPRHLVINDVKFSPSYSGMTLGRSRALDLAYCTDSGQLKILRCKDARLLKDWEGLKELSCKEAFTCLAWNVDCKTSMIAVGTCESSAKDTPRGEVRLYEYDDHKHEWVFRDVIAKTHSCQVHDVAFAPNPGRSFHTIAIASSNLQVVDFKSENGRVKHIGQEKNKVDSEQNKVEVWKLSWSSLGTTLCATGDDGLIRLWKNNNKWECSKTIKWNGVPV